MSVKCHKRTSRSSAITSNSIGPLSDLADPRAVGRTEHERAELDLSHGASDLPERKKRDERDAQKSGDAQRANNAPAAKALVAKAGFELRPIKAPQAKKPYKFKTKGFRWYTGISGAECKGPTLI